MDRTEKYYIEMCEKAKEIQKLWIPKVGDWVWKGKKYLRIEDACGIITYINFQKSEEIWLPGQDQLQRMINEEIVARYIKLVSLSTSMFYSRFKALNLWIDKLSGEKNHYADKLLTFGGEQLWLAFVMYEKYNKVWGEEDWIEKVKVPRVGGIRVRHSDIK